MDLIIIGLLGGLITGISPCILPVLPVIFLTGGAQSASFDGEVAPAKRSRPYFVIAGLVLSFSLVTLAGSLVLGLLNLPQDIIRWVGIAVLIIIGISLIIPNVAHLLEKPFQRFGQREVKNRGNGFGVGLALGAVFVPCAGPVLAAIIVAGATGTVGVGTVVLTVSFAVGVSVPLLVFALAGRSLVNRIRAFRTRERGLRIAAGVSMVLLAIGLVFNVPQQLQQLLPDYTAPLQEQIAQSDQVKEALNLGGLVNDENKDLDKCSNGATELESCGKAPSIKGIDQWLNTPNGEAVHLDELTGKVVLIDFWAYSCINCQRSLPHVTAWDKTYRDYGLQVIGIHSPEYAFEKNPENVKAGVERFGIEYPVALDNNLATWTNYRNRYWPAHYVIDAAGTVRHISFGEGNYAATEQIIRELLQQANPDVTLPPATEVADDTPQVGSTTQETFLGSSKDVNYGGDDQYSAGSADFSFPTSQQPDTFALDGSWRIETQFATPTASDAQTRLTYHASEVRVVVAGEGTITVTDQNGATQHVKVSGTPQSYQLVKQDSIGEGTLTLTVPEGIQVYSFTFG